MRFELTTSTLARLRSTPELRPLNIGAIIRKAATNASLPLHGAAADAYDLPMNATPDDLLKYLQGLGLATETHDHAPVFTVEEANAQCGHLPGGHCKNLFLKDKKGALWLVVCLNHRAIDMIDLRHRIGSHHLSFGKPDLLAEVLGVTPGSVTPFALINDTEGRIRVFLDSEMMTLERLNFHPLINSMTTAITPDDLLTFISATGHSPETVAL